MVDVIPTAREALRRWIAGAGGGDWRPLVELLAPDVAFSVPVDGFLGNRTGRADAERFFAYLTGAVRADLEPTSMLVDGDRVAFEVAVHGRWQGRPFRQGLCLVFVVRDGVIVEFREYLAWPGGLPAD
jgi:ketosteroid isomerase-like protein